MFEYLGGLGVQVCIVQEPAFSRSVFSIQGLRLSAVVGAFGCRVTRKSRTTPSAPDPSLAAAPTPKHL